MHARGTKECEQGKVKECRSCIVIEHLVRGNSFLCSRQDGASSIAITCSELESVWNAAE